MNCYGHGFDIIKVITATFAIGSALAAIGAIIGGVKISQVQPMMGVDAWSQVLHCAVIGGIGKSGSRDRRFYPWSW
jgi:branched-chain amino acid transport system permease protein